MRLPNFYHKSLQCITLGAAIALSLAILSPDALAASVLADAPLTVDERPTIKEIARGSGPKRGGAVVTLSGNFAGGVKVTVGGKRAFVVSRSANKVVIITPPGTKGRCDLVVTTPGGRSTKTRYTYL